MELSGGRVAEGGAGAGVLLRDAALVILDEPTAALDAEAEYRLFEQFRELVRGKTALIISHRFSTVRMADHIVWCWMRGGWWRRAVTLRWWRRVGATPHFMRCRPGGIGERGLRMVVGLTSPPGMPMTSPPGPPLQMLERWESANLHSDRLPVIAACAAGQSVNVGCLDPSPVYRNEFGKLGLTNRKSGYTLA